MRRLEGEERGGSGVKVKYFQNQQELSKVLELVDSKRVKCIKMKNGKKK